MTLPSHGLLVAHEPTGAGGETPIAPLRTDDDKGRALAAAGDANSVLGPLNTADPRTLENRLYDFSREDGRRRRGAVHLELAARGGRLHRRALHAVEELGLSGAPCSGQCGDHRQTSERFHGTIHGFPPSHPSRLARDVSAFLITRTRCP